MIWQDRERTDPTKRKFIDENGNEQNVNIEEIQSNITQSGTPVNATTMNNIEKNLGTYGNDTYDSTATYLEGETVTHNALLYRAKQDIDTPEEWTAEHWEETSVLDELANTSGNEVLVSNDEQDITRQTKLFIDSDTGLAKYRDGDTFEVLQEREVVIGEEEDITPQTKILIEELPEGSNIPYINSEIAIGSSNEDNRPVWFKQGKNLINKEAWFFGYFGNTGSMNYSKNNATFNFIEVLPNTNYTFSVNSNTTWFAITEFNDSTFIRRDTASSYPASQLTITTSATTNYVAISLNHSDSQMTQAKIDEREPQFELGNTATTYEDFITPEIITNNDNIFYTAPNEKWERLTLSSEFKNYNNDVAYQPKIKKEGNVVTIVGIVSPTADITNTSTEHTICTISQQYRPKDMPVHQICQASGMNKWLLIVGVGGGVTLSRYGITEMTTASANSWLPFTITYLV